MCAAPCALPWECPGAAGPKARRPTASGPVGFWRKGRRCLRVPLEWRRAEWDLWPAPRCVCQRPALGHTEGPRTPLAPRGQGTHKKISTGENVNPFFSTSCGNVSPGISGRRSVCFGARHPAARRKCGLEAEAEAKKTRKSLASDNKQLCQPRNRRNSFGINKSAGYSP